MRIALACALLLAACKGDPVRDARDAPSPSIAREPTSAAPEASAPPIAPSASASAAVDPARPRPRVVLASEEGDAGSLIRVERLKAKQEGRVLVVYVGASWCPPCKKLKAELERGVHDETFANLTLLEFDADRDTERLAALGYKVDYIPYAALPAADGRPGQVVRATGKGAKAHVVVTDELARWSLAAKAP